MYWGEKNLLVWLSHCPHSHHSLEMNVAQRWAALKVHSLLKESMWWDGYDTGRSGGSRPVWLFLWCTTTCAQHFVTPSALWCDLISYDDARLISGRSCPFFCQSAFLQIISGVFRSLPFVALQFLFLSLGAVLYKENKNMFLFYFIPIKPLRCPNCAADRH